MKTTIHPSKIRDLFDYDENTGELTWKSRPPHLQKFGTLAGCPNGQGHLLLGIKDKTYLVHRIVWAWVHGDWPIHEIDHINGDGMDNRLRNLREANRSQNACNRKNQKNNTSGVKGVSWNKQKGKWRARVAVYGKSYHAGFHNSLSHAANAIAEVRISVHKEFSRHA